MTTQSNMQQSITAGTRPSTSHTTSFGPYTGLSHHFFQPRHDRHTTACTYDTLSNSGVGPGSTHNNKSYMPDYRTIQVSLLHLPKAPARTSGMAAPSSWRLHAARGLQFDAGMPVRPKVDITSSASRPGTSALPWRNSGQGPPPDATHPRSHLSRSMSEPLYGNWRQGSSQEPPLVPKATSGRSQDLIEKLCSTERPVGGDVVQPGHRENRRRGDTAGSLTVNPSASCASTTTEIEDTTDEESMTHRELWCDDNTPGTSKSTSTSGRVDPVLAWCAEPFSLSEGLRDPPLPRTKGLSAGVKALRGQEESLLRHRISQGRDDLSERRKSVLFRDEVGGNLELGKTGGDRGSLMTHGIRVSSRVGGGVAGSAGGLRDGGREAQLVEETKAVGSRDQEDGRRGEGGNESQAKSRGKRSDGEDKGKRAAEDDSKQQRNKPSSSRAREEMTGGRSRRKRVYV